MAVAPRGETPRQRRERQRNEQAQARAEESFSRARNAHASYGAQLRQLARQVARIIAAHAPYPEDAPIPPGQLARIESSLAAYAEAITPWARATAARMIAEVNRRDKTAWERYTRGMSQALRAELQRAPIGAAVQELLEQQVDLITSLPWDAARRVQEKSLEAMETGARYPERVSEIEEALAEVHPEQTEAWLANRTTLIARTETARAQSVLTQARSRHIGAEEYVWRTAGDWKVRPSHKRLNGTVHRWDENGGAGPLSDPPNYHSHPGQIWNCRCVALPVLPEG